MVRSFLEFFFKEHVNAETFIEYFGKKRDTRIIYGNVRNLNEDLDTFCFFFFSTIFERLCILRFE